MVLPPRGVIVSRLSSLNATAWAQALKRSSVFELTNYLEKNVGMDVCSSNIRVVPPNMISLARA
jgi:hypothetical protein